MKQRKGELMVAESQKSGEVDNPSPKGRDGAQYFRQQQGHSLIKHILLCCVLVGFFTIPYYSISKNHYWHA